MKVLTALLLAVTFQAVAQSPQVPHKMQFAGMTLTIRDDARREIQKDVDALTQSPRHFNIKVERAKTYFPIIEKIFAEENVPDDFKYLVIQESALISDAVSTSNAVGFWQFKDFTALEMGLRVDRDIDERLNIVSASRGAARYIKKNNVFFNNWLYALQAYQMGAGGVMKSVTESHSGATHMEITSKTYWYVKKYLAHKVAFEEAVKGRGQIEVMLYENKTKKELSDLAKEVSVDEEQLRTYNKWAKKGTVPDDRSYVVLIPVSGGSSVNLSAVPVVNPISQADARKGAGEKINVPATAVRAQKINGIPTVIAAAGETPTKLAARANVDLSSFLRWNDISISTPIEQGRLYLLGKKRNRASEQYHKVLPGDDLWKVSQQYGIQLRKLRKFNRLPAENTPIAPGTTLWLMATRPKDSATPVAAKNVVQIADDSFAWDAGGEASSTVAVPVIEKVVPAKQDVKIEPVKEENAVLVAPDSTKTLQAVVTPVVEKDSTFTVVVPDPVLNKEEHVVTAKETLYGIARTYNVGVMDLVNWNNLDLQQGIKPGQVLKLKDPALAVREEPVQPEKELWHEVKATDTLYSVARKYNVTIKELMDWNGKNDFALSVGEKLRIVKR